MIIAILVRSHEPFSLRIYREHIMEELILSGVRFTVFGQSDAVPDQCDLVWDPGLAGSMAPHPPFRHNLKPLVASVHGAGPFSLGSGDIYPGIIPALRGKLQKQQARSAWQWFKERVSSVITVSDYGAKEISSAFGLPRSIIRAVHHGCDHTVFYPRPANTANNKYIFHASQFRPKKNVDRIIAAYRGLIGHEKPEMVMVLPGYSGSDWQGIRVIREQKGREELAGLYSDALFFVFPSLHESFGMPILEAMACGCPVITSNSTGCAEVAGDAALLVSPSSVNEITAAMQRMTRDDDLRESLRTKGLARARQFTWRKSAAEHMAVFERVLGGAR